MTPITPTHSIRDTARKSTKLWFDPGPVPTGEYDVRGGICWPIPTPEGGVQGFAVVLARGIHDNIYYWLDETPWICVDHVIEGQKIAFEGVAPWLNDAWKKYHLGQWYYHGERELAFRYRRQIKKSDQVKPKPLMAESMWDEDSYAVSILREFKEVGRLSMPRESAIAQAETMWGVVEAGSDMPGPLLALCSVLVAMEQYRWDAWRR